MNPYSRVNVLEVFVEPTDMDGAVSAIYERLRSRRKGFICLVGVHGIMEAQRDPVLAALYRQATLMLPDGMPTVWIGRWQGFAAMQRVAGPDLMLEVFRRPEFAHYRHYLYGGKPGVVQDLRANLLRQFPEASIIGQHTPPFRDLTPQEETALVQEIDRLQPDIIWVGISTPRQERFMHRMLPRLKTTLMFGVGAAFDFHTGRIKDAPQWVKSAGLQWLHRLVQDPGHLFARYLRNNTGFVWKVGLQLCGLRTKPSVVEDKPPAAGMYPKTSRLALHK